MNNKDRNLKVNLKDIDFERKRATNEGTTLAVQRFRNKYFHNNTSQ